MEKTKLGVSVAFLSALCYFMGYINLAACTVLFAVVLACSGSAEAKKNASQALILSVFFTAISMVLNWLSGSYIKMISTVSGWFVNWFSWYDAYEVMSKFNIMGILLGFIGIVECVLMVIFVIMSLKGKNIRIPVISKVVEKHVDCESEEI